MNDDQFDALIGVLERLIAVIDSVAESVERMGRDVDRIESHLASK